MSEPTDEQQIEYWSERARHAEAEVERLRAKVAEAKADFQQIAEICEQLKKAIKGGAG